MREPDAERGDKRRTRGEDRTEGKPDIGSGIIASSQNPSDKLRKDFSQQWLGTR
jgi:hypothetical protein